MPGHGCSNKCLNNYIPFIRHGLLHYSLLNVSVKIFPQIERDVVYYTPHPLGFLMNKTLTQFWQATLRQFSLTKGIKTDDFNPHSLLSITFPITNTINNTSTCNKRLT